MNAAPAAKIKYLNSLSIPIQRVLDSSIFSVEAKVMMIIWTFHPYKVDTGTLANVLRLPRTAIHNALMRLASKGEIHRDYGQNRVDEKSVQAINPDAMKALHAYVKRVKYGYLPADFRNLLDKRLEQEIHWRIPKEQVEWLQTYDAFADRRFWNHTLAKLIQKDWDTYSGYVDVIIDSPYVGDGEIDGIEVMILLVVEIIFLMNSRKKIRVPGAAIRSILRQMVDGEPDGKDMISEALGSMPKRLHADPIEGRHPVSHWIAEQAQTSSKVEVDLDDLL